MYWCYFLREWKEEYGEKIKALHIITSIKKIDIKKMDTIIIYHKNMIHSRFIGYVNMTGDFVWNDGCIKIFDTESMNKYCYTINRCKLVNNIIRRNIISDDKEMELEFERMRKKDTSGIEPMTEKMGSFIKNILREDKEEIRNVKKNIDTKKEAHNGDDQEQEQKNKGSERSDEDKDEDEDENEDENDEIVEDTCMRMTKMIIPILIVPCEYLLLHRQKTAQKFMDHIMGCKKCDITNNNERVFLDIVYDYPIKYAKLENEEVIEKIVEKYNDVDFYKDDKTKGLIRIIEITREDDEYEGCYFIVGMMNEKR